MKRLHNGQRQQAQIYRLMDFIGGSLIYRAKNSLPFCVKKNGKPNGKNKMELKTRETVMFSQMAEI
jgi:hypothetical protein